MYCDAVSHLIQTSAIRSFDAILRLGVLSIRNVRFLIHSTQCAKQKSLSTCVASISRRASDAANNRRLGLKLLRPFFTLRFHDAFVQTARPL